MRTEIGAVLAYFIIGGNAFAADLPLRPQPTYAPPVPEMLTWTGLYVGAAAGSGFGTADTHFNVAGGPTFASVNLPLKGAIGGGQIGYNWQSGAMVFGAEADFQASLIKGSITTPCIPPFCALPLTASYSQKLPWFGTCGAVLAMLRTGGSSMPLAVTPSAEWKRMRPPPQDR